MGRRNHRQAGRRNLIVVALPMLSVPGSTRHVGKAEPIKCFAFTATENARRGVGWNI